jgi:2-polyprenyl-3-methyl-5-hydroxy-6-metoxy-1,4-benzoquinol methylase
MSTNSYLINSKRFKWGPGSITLNPDKVRFLKKYTKGSCLDVGTGSGIYANFLYSEGHFTVGVDNEIQFVKKASKNFKNVTFKKADAYNLPFKDKQFDTLIAFDILEHLDDEKALKEFLRVAQRVLFSVPHKNQTILEEYGLSHSHYLDNTHKRVYDKQSLAKLAKKNHLQIISLKNSLPISISGLLIERLSKGNMLKKYLLKVLLKPFLPEPSIYSTVFGVLEKAKSK